MCIWIQSVLDSDNSWTHIFHVNMNLKNQVIIKGKPKSKRVCELKQNIWWAASTGVVPRRKSIAGLVWKKTRGGQIVELAREEEKKKKEVFGSVMKKKGLWKVNVVFFLRLPHSMLQLHGKEMMSICIKFGNYLN